MSQQGMTIVSAVVPDTGDDMADNYYPFPIFVGGTQSVEVNRIGYARNDTLKRVVHSGDIDDGDTLSLHLPDDTTAYQNNSGKIAYAIVTFIAASLSGARSIKIYSAPTSDSVTGATEVWNSDDHTVNSWSATNSLFTSVLVEIQDSHYIVIENNTGLSGRVVRVQANNEHSLVIEQA